jgi:hypothetical protein
MEFPYRYPWPRLLVTLMLILGLGSFSLSTAYAADKSPVRVKVADPFIELHSGPNTSFPVYDVVERGETIEILRRRTGWFEIRATKNRQGWVKKDQLQATLAAAGIQPTRRDRVVDKYLDKKLRFDAAGGVFDDEAIVTIRGGYRTSDHVTVEVSVSNVSGIYADSNLFQANVLIDLQVLNSIRPYFLFGTSYFTNVPETQSSTDTVVTTERNDEVMANFGVGVQYFFTQRFLFRAEVEQHSTLQGNRPSQKFLQGTLGVGFFF